MMTRENWKTLYKAFQEEEPFWETNCAEESDFEGLNLFDWLECGSYGPSWKMINEFSLRGYDIFCIERDSFGWLIGGIKRKLEPTGKTILFVFRVINMLYNEGP